MANRRTASRSTMRSSSPSGLLLLLLIASCQLWRMSAFVVYSSSETASSSSTCLLAGGEGGETEWSKALFENSGESQQLEKLKMQGLINKNANNNPKMEQNANLIAWLEQEGDVYLSDQSSWGEAPHPLAISTDTKDEITNEKSGRGLLARRDINDGDELLRIPIDLCLTKSAARRVLGNEIIQPGMNEYLAIAVHLMFEKNNPNSYYRPYLDILPAVNEVNPTFTWSEDDLNYLQGSPVVAATQSLKAKLQREYDDLFNDSENGLFVKFPDRFSKDKYTFALWEFCFVILFSRAIRLRSLKAGERLALVPYADLINHSPFSQAYVDARESGDWLFKNGQEEVILFADRGYRRMEQIYISYGPKSNAELLLLYGFAVERNPFNSVDVTVSIAPRTASFVKELNDDSLAVDPLGDEKLEFLESVSRANTVDFPCYADRFPTEMLEYLRLLQMTPEDTRGKPLADFDYSRTISSANEAAVLNCVVEAVTRQLDKYPQTEEDDADIIKDKSLFRLLSYNQRMAVRHRRNEKRLLKRTIAALKKQIRAQGLEGQDLQRAEGSTLGKVLAGDKKRYGMKQRTALEDRLEKMGLPVDLR